MTKSTEKSANIAMRASEGESDGQLLARASLMPSVNASISHSLLAKAGRSGLREIKLQDLIDQLEAQIAAVKDNDLSHSEAMLLAQAQTLDSIFHTTLHRAVSNMGEYPQTMERYMRLALKAQSQCRTTLEAVTQLRTPKVSKYVAQQNIAHGHQQVNNSTETGEQNQNLKNELLEDVSGERLDFGTAAETVGDDSPVEAVGALDGTKIS